MPDGFPRIFAMTAIGIGDREREDRERGVPDGGSSRRAIPELAGVITTPARIATSLLMATGWVVPGATQLKFGRLPSQKHLLPNLPERFLLSGYYKERQPKKMLMSESVRYGCDREGQPGGFVMHADKVVVKDLRVGGRLKKE